MSVWRASKIRQALKVSGASFKKAAGTGLTAVTKSGKHIGAGLKVVSEKGAGLSRYIGVATGASLKAASETGLKSTSDAGRAIGGWLSNVTTSSLKRVAETGNGIRGSLKERMTTSYKVNTVQDVGLKVASNAEEELKNVTETTLRASREVMKSSTQVNNLKKALGTGEIKNMYYSNFENSNEISFNGSVECEREITGTEIFTIVDRKRDSASNAKTMVEVETESSIGEEFKESKVKSVIQNSMEIGRNTASKVVTSLKDVTGASFEVASSVAASSAKTATKVGSAFGDILRSTETGRSLNGVTTTGRRVASSVGTGLRYATESSLSAVQGIGAGMVDVTTVGINGVTERISRLDVKTKTLVGVGIAAGAAVVALPIAGIATAGAAMAPAIAATPSILATTLGTLSSASTVAGSALVAAQGYAAALTTGGALASASTVAGSALVAAQGYAAALTTGGALASASAAAGSALAAAQGYAAAITTGSVLASASAATGTALVASQGITMGSVLASAGAVANSAVTAAQGAATQSILDILFSAGTGAGSGQSAQYYAAIVANILEDATSESEEDFVESATSAETGDYSKFVSVAVKAIIGAGLAVGGATLILPTFGFTPAGVAAGSLAAAVHSSIGSVAVGSTFALLQSAGVLGFAGTTKIAIGIGGALFGIAYLPNDFPPAGFSLSVIHFPYADFALGSAAVQSIIGSITANGTFPLSQRAIVAAMAAGNFAGISAESVIAPAVRLCY